MGAINIFPYIQQTQMELKMLISNSKIIQKKKTNT